MTAPDVDTDTGALRESLAARLWLAQPEYTVSPWDEISEMTREQYRTKADAVLALPALRDLIAERDQAVAAVERVEELLDPANRMAYQLWGGRLFSEKSVRRALDGDQ